jgi:hypothetical protein
MEQQVSQDRERLPLLTASRLRDARACQRLHKLRYIDGYVPLEEVGVLRFGTLIHRALEAWWNAPKASRLDNALDALASEPSDPFDLARARALIIGYHERWHREDLEPLAVEGEFRVPLINPETGAASLTWQLGGKFDVIVRDVGNRVILMEHKTTSEAIAPGSDYWKRLRLDGQLSIYFQGARASGFDVAACLYDVIGKPGIRPHRATPVESRKYKADGTLYANQRATDEAPEEFEARLIESIAEDPSRYYARGEIVRLDSEMDEAMFDAWTTAQQLRAAEVVKRFPRNPDACVRYGRTCQFFGVCTGEASIEDELLFRRVSNVHPELSIVSS